MVDSGRKEFLKLQVKYYSEASATRMGVVKQQRKKGLSGLFKVRNWSSN